MGTYTVSLKHLYEIIRTANKIDHALSKSDLNVHDKQNFASCQKIGDEKVLNLLLINDHYKTTYNYLLTGGPGEKSQFFFVNFSVFILIFFPNFYINKISVKISIRWYQNG